MKIKFLLKMFTLLFFSIYPLCATDVTKSVSNTPKEEKKVSRAISEKSTVSFEKSTVTRNETFFVGAKNINQGNKAISKVVITSKDSSTQAAAYSTAQLALEPMAVTPIYVNPSEKDIATMAKKPNPLYNADIKVMAHVNDYVLAVPGTRNPDYVDAATIGDSQNICLITAGDTLNTNTLKINDANAQATAGIVGLAGSPRYIFAAVKPFGGQFGDANSGIALVRQATTGLTAINAVTGKEGNKAANLLSAGTNITIQNDTVVMHWDNTLQRLFVGLHVTRNSGTATGLPLLVGRVDSGAESILTLESALPENVMTTGVDDYIVGFKSSANRGAIIRHIATMHTNTRKAYVIVNGNVYDTTTSPSVTGRLVFALPIVQQQHSDQKLSTAETNNIGRISAKNNVNQDKLIVPTDTGTLQSDDTAKVGQGLAPGDVDDMFVVGSAVYVCCSKITSFVPPYTVSTDVKVSHGIFHSTPVFDSNGMIRKWTPWQRVISSTDRVFAGIRNGQSGQYTYLTKTDNEWDTVKNTLWGKRDNAQFGGTEDALESTFNKASGGIHQVFNFCEKTPSFAEDEFSLMVATGLGRIALIQTGEDTGEGFLPTINPPLFYYSGEALRKIGPICAAAISDSDEGWLFVGGYNGVAVLCSSNGDGWLNLNDLSTLAGSSFKTLGSFENVHKLVCDDKYLYILTDKKLYRLEMTSDQFSNPSAAVFETIAEQKGNDYFLDFIVSGKLGVLASSTGLYRTSNGKNISGSLADAQSWTEIKTRNGYGLGAVTHLYLQLHEKGVVAAGGNLYALGANMSTDLSAVVRYDVQDTRGANVIDDSTVVAITEGKSSSTKPDRDFYYAFGEIRSSFVPDGTFGLHALSRHFGRSNLVRIISMVDIPSTIRSFDHIIPFYAENKYTTGIPTQNSASGAWIVYGDWGIRINE